MNTGENIMQQLGGNRFAAMTGARNFGTSGNNLSFKIPGRKVSHVNILLNHMDLYDVFFMKIRGTDCKVVKSMENVYAHDLQRVFTEVTGLDTHL